MDQPFVVLTGETGAGKSLFLQAIKFLSGGKKPTSPPPNPDTQTTVSCDFCPSILPHLNQELFADLHHHLQKNRPQSICVQRILNPQGKSKRFIADRPASLAQVKHLMQIFFEINGQHQHLTLLNQHTQRVLLDRFGQYDTLLQLVAAHYQKWQQALTQLKEKQLALAALSDIDHLQTILKDLASLDLENIDLEHLHQRQQKLQSRQSFLQACACAQNQLDGEHPEAVLPQLFDIQRRLSDYHTLYPESNTACQLIADAHTLCQEALSNFQSALTNDYSDDAEQLITIDQQLSAIHDCARKHRVQPEALKTLYVETVVAQETHNTLQSEIQILQQSLHTLENAYQSACAELSQQRITTAKTLSTLIIDQLPKLNLPHALFHIKITPDAHPPCATGTDHIDFLFTGNPGIALSKLDSCASGGEIARLSLLLSANIPSDHARILIFDEADVGVSGKTALLIGKLMQKIARHHQVICLTHSPQVAACGMAHWHIEKKHFSGHTRTQLHVLSADAHVEEVARLLSGLALSTESIASARQLCEDVQA